MIPGPRAVAFPLSPSGRLFRSPRPAAAFHRARRTLKQRCPLTVLFSAAACGEALDFHASDCPRRRSVTKKAAHQAVFAVRPVGLEENWEGKRPICLVPSRRQNHRPGLQRPGGDELDPRPPRGRFSALPARPPFLPQLPRPAAFSATTAPPGRLFRHNCPARPRLFTTPGEGLTAAGIPPYFPLALPLSCRPRACRRGRCLFRLPCFAFLPSGCPGARPPFSAAVFLTAFFATTAPTGRRFPRRPAVFRPGNAAHCTGFALLPLLSGRARTLDPRRSIALPQGRNPAFAKKDRLHHPRSPMHLLPALRRICCLPSVAFAARPQSDSSAEAVTLFRAAVKSLRQRRRSGSKTVF